MRNFGYYPTSRELAPYASLRSPWTCRRDLLALEAQGLAGKRSAYTWGVTDDGCAFLGLPIVAARRPRPKRKPLTKAQKREQKIRRQLDATRAFDIVETID